MSAASDHALDRLLHRLVDAELSADDAAVQLAHLLQTQPHQPRLLVLRIQALVAAGQLTANAGRRLLAVLEYESDRTQALSDRTEVQSTKLRPSADDRTRVRHPAPAADHTLIRPAIPAVPGEPTQRMRNPDPNATLIRPAQSSFGSEPTVRGARPFDHDATVRKHVDADHTQRMADATRVRDLEPTQRKAPAGDTVQRTLRSSGDRQADANHTIVRIPASNVGDRTEVIAERRVRSLDSPEGAYHGDLQPGMVVKNRFVLDSLIGKGGMGLVFAAIDRRKEEARDPNPRVALKLLNSDFQQHPQSLIALQREARKAQSLAHPNVVTVFDFDRDGDAVYMTMELLEGRSLDALVREARGNGAKPEIVLPIIRGIAEGLAYAHRKGIVHSDLKPGNVFVTTDNTPKILDFGIARAVPNANSDEAKDVFDAGSLGAYTEAYATTEMVAGTDPHPADDMYALGIIGYELLTGFHPYKRHSAPKAQGLALKPPPLKGLKLREARALERCLAFDREQRPQDAAEFLKAFRGVTRLQQSTFAAAAVLAVTAGYFWYENYREAGPAIAFSELPMAAQQTFAEKMQEGDTAWALYRRDRYVGQLQDAVDFYNQAYVLHPRNRDAVGRLNRAADALLERAGELSQEQRRKLAQDFQARSEYYLKYAPIVDAAR